MFVIAKGAIRVLRDLVDDRWRKNHLVDPEDTDLTERDRSRTKVKLGKAQKQNRPLPHWFRLKSDTKIRWNAKRRNWRHTKMNI
ncbi:60S ribosomal protein L39 [Apophysomyces sp. BC1021]|nr:60S ribosomal protein L39 [Apophysomyces sp. BC1021]